MRLVESTFPRSSHVSGTLDPPLLGETETVETSPTTRDGLPRDGVSTRCGVYTLEV